MASRGIWPNHSTHISCLLLSLVFSLGLFPNQTKCIGSDDIMWSIRVVLQLMDALLRAVDVKLMDSIYRMMGCACVLHCTAFLCYNLIDDPNMMIVIGTMVPRPCTLLYASRLNNYLEWPYNRRPKIKYYLKTQNCAFNEHKLKPPIPRMITIGSPTHHPWKLPMGATHILT